MFNDVKSFGIIISALILPLHNQNLHIYRQRTGNIQIFLVSVSD